MWVWVTSNQSMNLWVSFCTWIYQCLLFILHRMGFFNLPQIRSGWNDSNATTTGLGEANHRCSIHTSMWCYTIVVGANYMTSSLVLTTRKKLSDGKWSIWMHRWVSSRIWLVYVGLFLFDAGVVGEPRFSPKSLDYLLHFLIHKWDICLGWILGVLIPLDMNRWTYWPHCNWSLANMMRGAHLKTGFRNQWNNIDMKDP